jgi:hypothetical protein
MTFAALQRDLQPLAVIGSFTAFFYGGAWAVFSVLGCLSNEVWTSPLQVVVSVAVTYAGYLGLKYTPAAGLPWKTQVTSEVIPESSAPPVKI